MAVRILSRRVGVAVLVAGIAVSVAGAQQATAWKDGRFQVDVAGVIGRSAIVLGQPNAKASEAMPLGNGRLGVAVWAADGLTAQLNRVDTMPYRLSPGQVVIPGLKALTSAKDYAGRLDLYNGVFEEKGGGMTATAYVANDRDALVIEVEGADAKTPQTAVLRLWAPRKPVADGMGKMRGAHGEVLVGTLKESWKDDHDPGASGRSFGSLAGITAEGRDVSVVVTDERTVTVTVTPFADGKFKILVGSPGYDGSGDAQEMVARAVSGVSAEKTRKSWNELWKRAGTMKVTSSDGAGEYMENLRNIYLYSAAAESGGEFPGSQAGIGDLFSAVRDSHMWDPAAFWHWNLRMQVAANLGAGLPELNAPYFNLYRGSLEGIEKWTREHMAGRPGICVPETMRFNGPGIEYENGPTWEKPITGMNCDAGSQPYYNARTISTGAEVSLWIWQQYLATKDRAFLEENYPVMAESARFLIDYEKPVFYPQGKSGNPQGKSGDGLLHTMPSNAHETQWDTLDPVTDLSARKALYPAVMEAAKLLDKDEDLAGQLKEAVAKIPEFPHTQHAGKLTLIAAGTHAEDVIAASYRPAAENHNSENIGLEPVWPFNLIGEGSPEFELARRTYKYRPYPVTEDWSHDPIQAARLGLRDEVGSTLRRLTERYQLFVNGFSDWGGGVGEFYVEQSGVVATALQEALVQDFDGVIRIAPAIPKGWDVDGSVYVRGKTKVDVQVRGGVPVLVAIEAGVSDQVKVKNPWPGEDVEIVEAGSNKNIAEDAKGAVIAFQAEAGKAYLVRKRGAVKTGFAAVDGVAAQAAKRLGKVQIGIFSAESK